MKMIDQVWIFRQLKNKQRRDHGEISLGKAAISFWKARSPFNAFSLVRSRPSFQRRIDGLVASGAERARIEVRTTAI
jgi:hypothetical protein